MSEGRLLNGMLASGLNKAELSTPNVFKYWALIGKGWRDMTSFVQKKNVWKRCCWNCNIRPDRFTSNQSHYRSYYNGIPEFVMKRWIYLNSKIAQTTQINIWNFTIYMKCKLRRLSGRFQTLIRETGRNGSKSRVSQIIRESWQHCKGCSVRLSDDYLTV